MLSLLGKKTACISLMLVCAIILSGCTAVYVIFSQFETKTPQESVHALCGLDITESTIIFYEDSHGGFLGDGALTVAFDCSQISDSVTEQIKQWNNMPLSHNLQEIMYDNIGYNLAEKNQIPKISSGYYYFTDRHSESNNPFSDTDLFNRASYNFSLLIYDSDSYTLYFFEFDT